MDTWSNDPFPEILNYVLTQESCKSAKNSWSYKPEVQVEVQVCAKTEIRGLEMAFLVKNLMTNQIGFEKVFDYLTFKHMDTLRKQIQSLFDYILNHWF